MDDLNQRTPSFLTLLWRYVSWSWMLACPPGDLLGHHAGLRANHQRLARWLPTYLRRYATAGGALAALLVLLHANVGGPTEALLALGCALVLGQLVVSGAVFIVLAVLRPR